MREDNKTLKIQFPLGGTLGLALLFFLLIISTSEIAARFIYSRPIKPELYISSSNLEWDIKLKYLDDLVEAEGEVDCIFMGSSQINTGINPEVFTWTYSQLNTTHITCFNFGLATLTASPGGELASILVERYRPDLFVYGTSARDFSPEYGGLTRPLLEDPWVAYKSGKSSTKGLFIDHLIMFRVIMSSYQLLSNPDHRMHIEKATDGLSTYGYVSLEGNDLSEPEGIINPGYYISQIDRTGFKKLLSLNDKDTQVIIIEAPIHKRFIPHYIGETKESYIDQFLDPVSELTRSEGVLFWQTSATLENVLPDDVWLDLKHLNKDGADIFSRWLAVKLADSINHGEIKDPFQ